MLKERAVELLGEIVDQIQNKYDTKETVEKLSELGFSKIELLEDFNFSIADIVTTFHEPEDIIELINTLEECNNKKELIKSKFLLVVGSFIGRKYNLDYLMKLADELATQHMKDNECIPEDKMAFEFVQTELNKRNLIFYRGKNNSTDSTSF